MNKKIVAVLFAVCMMAVGVTAFVLGPSLIGQIGGDSQSLCFKSDATGWECSKAWGMPKGTVTHQVAGTELGLTVKYDRPSTYTTYGKITKVQVKLNAIPGKPGNDELYQSALNNPDPWSGGCWDGTSNRRDVASCEAIGGEAFLVLGFEDVTTYYNYYNYDLENILVPGFYYVKPLVTRDGSPHGYNDWDFELLLAESVGPIYFALAPTP